MNLDNTCTFCTDLHYKIIYINDFDIDAYTKRFIMAHQRRKIRKQIINDELNNIRLFLSSELNEYQNYK